MGCRKFVQHLDTPLKKQHGGGDVITDHLSADKEDATEEGKDWGGFATLHALLESSNRPVVELERLHVIDVYWRRAVHVHGAGSTTDEVESGLNLFRLCTEGGQILRMLIESGDGQQGVQDDGLTLGDLQD